MADANSNQMSSSSQSDQSVRAAGEHMMVTPQRQGPIAALTNGSPLESSPMVDSNDRNYQEALVPRIMLPNANGRGRSSGPGGSGSRDTSRSPHGRVESQSLALRRHADLAGFITTAPSGLSAIQGVTLGPRDGPSLGRLPYDGMSTGTMALPTGWPSVAQTPSWVTGTTTAGIDPVVQQALEHVRHVQEERQVGSMQMVRNNVQQNVQQNVQIHVQAIASEPHAANEERMQLHTAAMHLREQQLTLEVAANQHALALESRVREIAAMEHMNQQEMAQSVHIIREGLIKDAHNYALRCDEELQQKAPEWHAYVQQEQEAVIRYRSQSEL